LDFFFEEDEAETEDEVFSAGLESASSCLDETGEVD
jgi:hypothetical protein